MKVSVIVPVYNGEKTLRACLDSLLGQTLGEPEIILVNDGSTDGTQTILDEYAARFPERVRCLRVENGGQGRARNLGMELARGDWLAFADSDDSLAPQMLEKLLTAAEAEGADLAVCDMLRRYPDGREQRVCTWRAERPLSAAGSVCDKLFRRDALGELRFPESLWYEDLAFSALALSRARKIAYVPEALYFYRCGHPSTMENDDAVRNRDLLQILELLRQPLEAAGRREDFESLLLDHVLLDGINRLRRQHGAEKETVILEFRNYVNQEIPDLRHAPAFRQESRNRRAAMWLNAHGLDRLTAALLRLKNG